MVVPVEVLSSIISLELVSDLIELILKVAADNLFLVIIVQEAAPTALLETKIVAVVEVVVQEISEF